MTHWERLRAVLAGRQPDHPPVAAWRHFPGQEDKAADLVAATLAFQSKYDWDLVKLQPAAVHFAEAWGAVYDYSEYAGNVPRLVRPAVASPADLADIASLSGAGGPFGTQLAVIGALRRALGHETPLVQTVFSPLSIVETLFGRHRHHRAESRLPDAMATETVLLHRSLAAITATLSDYGRRALAAGADGIFFAVTGLATQGYLTPAEYAAFGRPYDLQLLEAVRQAPLNILHVCGPGAYFDDFLDYPVAVLSWAAAQPGNPSLAEALTRTRAVLMAGLGEKAELRHGTPAEVRAAVETALASAGGRLIVAPECSYDVATPEANVLALRRAVGPRAAG